MKFRFNYIVLLFLFLQFPWIAQGAYPESSGHSKKPKQKSSVSKSGPSKTVAKYKTPAKKVYVSKSKSSVKKKAPIKKAPQSAASLLPSSKTQLKNGYIQEVISPTDERLELANIQIRRRDDVTLSELPEFRTAYKGQVAGITSRKEYIQYTIDQTLQNFAKAVVQKARTQHVAIVAMEPATGKILAIAGKSPSINNIELHAGFPAASLFKVITAAASIESSHVRPDTEVMFRGGTYELSRVNYNPNAKRDNRQMTVGEALGKSCNPVFSHVALKYLNPTLLRHYASVFGFNESLSLPVMLPQSTAFIPNEDYEFGRTAAGFGDVYISPVHAAAIMSGIINKGRMPTPTFVDQVVSATGESLYKFSPSITKELMQPETAKILQEMMVNTTTIGTSKKEFLNKFPYTTPAKTGTLKGTNPNGLNNWFIGAAPQYNPRIAIAVVVVNPQHPTAKASHLGKLMLEKYLG